MYNEEQTIKNITNKKKIQTVDHLDSDFHLGP
jgi:hypothetical protein